jgi:hypothetical protein
VRPAAPPSVTLPTMQPVDETQHTTTTIRPYSTLDTESSMPYSAGGPYEQIVSNPINKHLISVFPLYLRNAIKKEGGRAAVSMTFTLGLAICVMRLEILPTKVQYLAMMLFGTHVETENGYRYILQTNGSKLFPENVTLQGGQGKAIPDLLGSWVEVAIAQCPIRIIEAEEESNATSCVAMRITSGCNDHAYLSVTMGFDEAFRIKEALFPSPSPSRPRL